MKKLFTILFLLSFVFLNAQTVSNGFTFYTVNADLTIGIKFPSDTSGGKKFPLIAAMGGNSETSISSMFNVGMGRQFLNYPSLMPDSIIYVLMFSTSNASALEQPVNQVQMFDWITTHTGRSDTTNWLMCGLSQGAVNTLSAPTWPTGIGFGNGGDYRYNRFKKFMAASSCGVRSNAVFTRLAGKRVHLMVGASDGTCGPAFTNQLTDSINANGGIATKVLLPSPYDHSNTTWDSAFSPRGTDSMTNIYLWAQNKGLAVTPTITLEMKAFYDFYYASQDQNNPYKFKDGNTSTEGTPRKMQDYYGFNKSIGANHVYHKDSKYGKCRGWIDLVGVTNLRDTTKKVRITSIQGYARGESGRKMYFFNGDKFWRPDYHERWKGVDDPYLYGFRPFDSLVCTGSNGWVTGSMTIPDSMRYVFVIIEGDSSTQQLGKFGELKFNGQRLYDSTTVTLRPAMHAGTMANQATDSTTLMKKSGVNWFNGYGTHSRSIHGVHRSFFNMSYGDTATAQGIPTKFRFPFTISGFDITAGVINAMKTEGKEIYFTNQGGSAYINANSAGVTNIDTVGGNPANPANWVRHGLYLKNVAKACGRTTGGTNDFSGTVANGQDLFRYMTHGNESNAHDGNDQVEFAMMSNSAYDGYENTLLVGGSPIGIKNGDPNMKVVMPALVDADTITIATQYFYAQMFRSDGKVPFDVIDFHKYFDTSDSLGGIQRDNNQKVGVTSATPEKAINSHTGFLKWADTLARRIYKYYPTSVPLWLSESGRSMYDTASANDIQAGSWDQSVTLPRGGYTGRQWKGILNVRELIYASISPIARHYNYSLVNSSGATQAAGRFASHGMAYNEDGSFPGELQSFYEDWYLTACLTTRGGNYAGDVNSAVLIDGGYTGLTQIEVMKPGTDSACSYVWFGSDSGQSSLQTVHFPGAVGSVEKVVLSFSAETGTSTYLSVTGGSTTTTINEVPTMFFYRKTSTGPSNLLRIYRQQ